MQIKQILELLKGSLKSLYIKEKTLIKAIIYKSF